MEEKQLEIADELAESERNVGLANARRALAPQHHEDFDGIHCLDCPEVMPQLRLDACRIRCTTCETRKEKRAARGY